MPKVRFNSKPVHYNRSVQEINCKPLLDDMHILVDRYLDELSLEDKKQLLYIAGVIESTHGQRLTPQRYHGYYESVNRMLRNCRAR